MGKLINYVQAVHWKLLHNAERKKIKQDKEVRDKSCSVIGRLNIVRKKFSPNWPIDFIQSQWTACSLAQVSRLIQSLMQRPNSKNSEGSKMLDYLQVKKLVYHSSLPFHRQYLIPRSQIENFISLRLSIPRYLSELNESVNAHGNFIWHKTRNNPNVH